MTFEEWWLDYSEEHPDWPIPFEAAKSAWNAALENQWQPMDTAPRDGTTIIIDFGDRSDVVYYDNGENHWDNVGWQYLANRYNKYIATMVDETKMLGWVQIPKGSKEE